MSSDDRLSALHAALVERVEGLVSGQDWTAFLAQSRRLHRYSPNNQALLAAQLDGRGIDPAAGQVASYRAWQTITDVNGQPCQVDRGEKALYVYAPLRVTRRQVDETTGDETVVGAGIRGFKPVPVFHSSQLAVEPALAVPPHPQLLQGDEAPGRVLDAITAELEADGWRVEMVPRHPGMTWNGRTHLDGARVVAVCEDLDPPQQLKTLAHEWAHVTLHAGGIEHRAVAEVEAESVAYLVTATVGVDAADYTIPYVTGWSGGDTDLVRATAERVLATTAGLVGRLEDRLGVDLTPDPLTPAAAHDQPAVHEPPGPGTVAGGVALGWVGDRLTDADAERLAAASAPEQVAYLFASAGLNAAQAAATLAGLGVDATTATMALTAIAPFDDPDARADALYPPADVAAAIVAAYPPSPQPEVTGTAGGRGLALIDQWAQLQHQPTNPAVVAVHHHDRGTR